MWRKIIKPPIISRNKNIFLAHPYMLCKNIFNHIQKVLALAGVGTLVMTT